jgi:hypothetical protein
VASNTTLPLFVTENGIATADDTRRTEFIRLALGGVERALADGIDVRGYFYWSALDNFEWMLGYRPTFGLVAVDRATQRRTVKDSARYLGDVARRHVLVWVRLPEQKGRACFVPRTALPANAGPWPACGAFALTLTGRAASSSGGAHR